ncbi:non-reducing end alpha-L-arabinofuranosidase family hydrolase [Kineococcus gypseus]|uniref:non-reducing end alpha-L-arabinofuranosidase family hydrolase n=1 Tax=Kineococcus gypseus TaxID=1637102 RepID=UPI003D7E9D10
MNPSASRTRRTAAAVLAAAATASALVVSTGAAQASAPPSAPPSAAVSASADAAHADGARRGTRTDFHWTSTGPLISPDNPRSDDRTVYSVKDPTIVEVDGTYHVFATISTPDGWNMVQTSFTDWSQASTAPLHHLDASPIGPGYRAAPQVFFFEPQGLWYLVYQDGNGAYSTTADISDPLSWSAPQHFYADMPDIVQENIGDGYWLDFWNVCDDDKCYLFSSDDNGHLYRSETDLEDFPNGYDDEPTVIALSDPDQNRLFEASNVYRIEGTGKYLLLHEAIGTDGRRWFRSWTSPSIDGEWEPLADSEERPYARSNNVSFTGTPWTQDISHGELIRSNVDQEPTIDPCEPMRFLYQGLDPAAGGDYAQLPYRLGLLTADTENPVSRLCRPERPEHPRGGWGGWNRGGHGGHGPR